MILDPQSPVRGFFEGAIFAVVWSGTPTGAAILAWIPGVAFAGRPVFVLDEET